MQATRIKMVRQGRGVHGTVLMVFVFDVHIVKIIKNYTNISLKQS